ncbi:unnamed protein product, partial [Agarophyton chilense]
LSQLSVWNDGALDVRDLHSAPQPCHVAATPVSTSRPRPRLRPRPSLRFESLPRDPPQPDHDGDGDDEHEDDAHEDGEHEDDAFHELGCVPPSRRAPDRTRPSMYALMQNNAHSGITRRKSLFSLSKSALQNASVTDYQRHQAHTTAPLIRRKSVHRYVRVTMPFTCSSPSQQKSCSPPDCDLDDLMQALHATHVVETSLPQQAQLADTVALHPYS